MVIIVHAVQYLEAGRPHFCRCMGRLPSRQRRDCRPGEAPALGVPVNIELIISDTHFQLLCQWRVRIFNRAGALGIMRADIGQLGRGRRPVIAVVRAKRLHIMQCDCRTGPVIMRNTIPRGHPARIQRGRYAAQQPAEGNRRPRRR